jgi:hypothetical protein
MTWLLMVLFACPTPPVQGPEPTIDRGAPPVGRATEYVVVHHAGEPDEQRLGSVSIDDAPPFRATVIDGGTGDSLRTLVDAMNALDHVMSAGLGDGPGTRIERADPQFFRIMRHGWLADTHGAALRSSPPAQRAARRYSAVRVRAGEPASPIADVEVDGAGYLRVLSGTAPPWLVERNRLESESVDVAPPAGERGSWSAAVPRGTPMFEALQRSALLEVGVVMLPVGTPTPIGLQPVDRSGLSAWVPGSLFIQPAGALLLELSGPPGGPLGMRVERYSGLAHEAGALTAWVAGAHGAEASFEAGSTAEIDVGGRPSLAATWRTGGGPARADHLTVLWPDAHGPSAADHGVRIELEVSGRDGPIDAAAIAAHPDLAVVLASLRADAH